MRRLVLFLLNFAILLCLPPIAAQTRTPASPLNPARDDRLSRKVRLRAEAIPVAWVLEALSERTGVKLQVVGRAGDERLVAFVPEAPLAEVLERIADLYRLTWTRVGKGERPTYRLQRTPAAARAEQALRDRALAQVLQRLSGRFQGAAPPEEARGRDEMWRSVYPDLLPLLARRGETLTRQGYIRLPIGALPPGERERVVQALSPILKESDRQRSAALLQFREEEIARGIPPEQATKDKPPSNALESVLTADLQLAQGLRASVGLRTNGDTWYHWFAVDSDDLDEPARALYSDRDLRVPERPGGLAATADPNDPLAKIVEIRRGDSEREGDWIATLGRISRTAGVPIYADCYPNYLEGAAGHPRAQLPSSGRGSVAQTLDALCYPTAPVGQWKARANSFWWRRGGSALIRSNHWIWEEQTVLPASLLESAIHAVRRTGTLTAAEVGGLASLDFFQLQQGDSLTRHLEHWRRAVRLPAALSLSARQSLFGAGVVWSRLSPLDQTVLARLLPDEDPTGFQARLRTEVRDQPAQGGTSLSVSFFATPMRGGRHFYLPLPGVAPKKGLPPRGLEVREINK